MSFIKKLRKSRLGAAGGEKEPSGSGIHEIGSPTGVKHNLHINIDMVTGDLILSDTWKKLLKSADIS